MSSAPGLANSTGCSCVVNITRVVTQVLTPRYGVFLKVWPTSHHTKNKIDMIPADIVKYTVWCEIQATNSTRQLTLGRTKALQPILAASSRVAPARDSRLSICTHKQWALNWLQWRNDRKQEQETSMQYNKKERGAFRSSITETAQYDSNHPLLTLKADLVTPADSGAIWLMRWTYKTESWKENTQVNESRWAEKPA